MKKILLMTLIFVFSMISICAHAVEGPDIIVEMPEIPQFSHDKTVSLMSAVPDIEDCVVAALTDMKETVDLSSFDIEYTASNCALINQRFQEILVENPLLYYVHNQSWSISALQYKRGDEVVKEIIGAIHPIYKVTDTDEIKRVHDAVADETESILMLIDDNMSDFEKVMTVHDYIVLNYEYDTSYAVDNITMMTEKKGTCMGYTISFAHIMNKLGIECKFVSGINPLNNAGHAWNLVRLGDEWYHIDLTWDDPTPDAFAQVHHNYSLLSENELRKIRPEYLFDTGSYKAESSMYDNAKWHKDVASVVYCEGKEYYIDGNELKCGDEIIYADLDGGDGRWCVGGGYVISDCIYAGLAEYDGTLYFNTDSAIYCYDPISGVTRKLRNEEGICGLYVDRNTLKFCKFSLTDSTFYKAGSIPLGIARIGGVTHEDGMIVTPIYKDDESPVTVISIADGTLTATCIKTKGLTKVRTPEAGKVRIFFWDGNLRPLSHAKQINK